MKTMWYIIILLLTLTLVFVFMAFAPKQTSAALTKKKVKTYIKTQLLRYTIDSVPEQTKKIATQRYKEYPPLRPERFRRRMKLLWGIDVKDYPQDALIWFGPDFNLSINNQIIIGFYKFRGHEPMIGDPPPENIYIAFGKYFLFNDIKAYQVLLEYMKDCEDANEYFFYDILLTIYNTSISIQPSLMKYIDSMTYTQAHSLNIFSIYGDNRREPELSAFRVSEIKSNLVYLYFKEQESKGRVLYNASHPVENMIDLGYAIDSNGPFMSLYDGTNPWHSDTRARSRAALLSFLLQLKHKNQNKWVIKYMSGQLDVSTYGVLEDQVREQIRSNNYYGYAILREFCENPEREMPTLEKVGTSFPGIVNKPNTLFYLEPYADSYDIDTIHPTETFKAYEMGYDDYYFVEVIKPVESPVAGPDGYAMILDRTETVYGYLRKSDVKEYTDMEKITNTIQRHPEKCKVGVITDPDGYVNIRKEMNSESDIIGKIEDKTVFYYWEDPANHWWLVETKDNIRGFVHKSRIKEKLETGGWILDE